MRADWSCVLHPDEQGRQTRDGSYLYFAGLGPGWNLCFHSFSSQTPSRASGLVKFRILADSNPCDFFQDHACKCHPPCTISNTVCWLGLLKIHAAVRRRKEEASWGGEKRKKEKGSLGPQWMTRLPFLMVPKTSQRELTKKWPPQSIVGTYRK